MSKTKIIYKLKKPFSELGIELKRNGAFYKLEYENLPILLSVDNETGTCVFVTLIIDTQDCLDETQLKIALDVVDGFHKDYSGEWNDGVPYFASPEYFIGDETVVTRGWLEKQLKEFWDAYIFLQANIHIMGDDSIMKMMGLCKEDEEEKE